MDNLFVAAEKSFTNRYIIAIKKAFTYTMPLIVIGSIASLINNVPIGFVQSFLSTSIGSFIRSVNGAVWLGTTAILALLILWNIGQQLAKSYGLNENMGGLAAVGGYFSTCITTDDGGIALSRLGSAGLFGAILIAVLSAELYRLFSRFRIRIGDEAAEEVSQMFTALIPVALSVLCIAVLSSLVTLTGRDINEWLFAALEFLFSAAKSGGIGGMLLLIFGIHILWFFGIHGGNVLDGIMTGAYGDVLSDNINRFAADGDAFNSQLAVVSKSFTDVFVIMGGAGTTLCLIIAVFIAGKSRYVRSIAKIGSVFAAFNINEILLFGLPVILSPIMLVPFILTPIALTLVSWCAINWGLVAHVVADVHWAMPAVFSGYIATGGHISGSILQIVNIAAGVLIYMPFVKMLDKRIIVKEESGSLKIENILHTVIGKVRSSTDEINVDIANFASELHAVSGELNSANSDVDRQMKMLRESASSLEEVSVSALGTHNSVKEVLDDAENAIKLSVGGAETMTTTTERIQEVVDATQSMTALSEQLTQRCGQIESILSTIEKIALQTTILSLNASIEAARAGETGKGFRVVAEDVKRLANTTSDAVQNVASLLNSMAQDAVAIEKQCRVSFQIAKDGQGKISDASFIFGNIMSSVQSVQERCAKVLNFSKQVDSEITQVREQLYATNEFFSNTASQTAAVSEKMDETSKTAAHMVTRLQNLSAETNRLATDVLSGNNNPTV